MNAAIQFLSHFLTPSSVLFPLPEVELTSILKVLEADDIYLPQTNDVKDGSNVLFMLFVHQNAVSMYCRLGFAVKKGTVFNSEQLHPTWKNAPSVNRLK